MNNVVLTGNLVRDIELKAVGQTMMAKFTLAVQRRFKKEGEQTADFINCIVWGKMAETMNTYLCKGSKIGVVGRIQTGSYENKEGQKVYTTDIIVESFEFLGGGAERPKDDNSSNDFTPVTSNEDIPF